jgi:decaprenylphospho-beta-D-erythro-pentofuranosid-2-ulose 2-reductase
VTDALGRFRKVLVLGGGSEIAHATLLELLRAGPFDVVLAARDPDRIDASELEAAGATVERVRFDAREHETHTDILAPVFNAEDVDLVLLAFGVLGDQAEAEHDPHAAVQIADTNYTGAVSALTIAAERLRAQGGGTIVVLSSVAAQRPRPSNYVYGASKAGLDAFARGLQVTAGDTGVRVLVVRPGFVRTQMTAGLAPAPFSVRPDRVAREIVSALRSGREIVWVPPFLRIVMWVVLMAPRGVIRKL